MKRSSRSDFRQKGKNRQLRHTSRSARAQREVSADTSPSAAANREVTADYSQQMNCECLRFGHIWRRNRWWSPTRALPKKCTRCKSPLWNTRRRRCGYGSKYSKAVA